MDLKMRFRLLVVLLSALCLTFRGPAAAQTAAPVLTRSAAAALIRNSREVQTYRVALALQNNWAQIAAAEDLMIGTTALPRLASQIQPCANPESYAHIVIGCSWRNLVPLSPLPAPRVTVTGIAEGALTKSAEFVWEYRSVPAPLRFLAVRGGNGVASFQKFDDGWRLSGVQAIAQPIPYPLSAADSAEVRRLIAAHESRVAAIKGSKTGNLVTSIAFQDQPSKLFEIFETFVRVTDRFGSSQTYEHYAYWFGNIRGVTASGNRPALVTISMRPGLDGSSAPTYPNFLPCVDLYFGDSASRDLFVSRLSPTIKAWEQRFPAAYLSPIEIADDRVSTETKCRPSKP